MNGSIKISDLYDSWNWFFHQPENPSTIALFRISFGLILFFDLLFHIKHINQYFGPDGVLNYDTWKEHFDKRYISIFRYLPRTIMSVRLVFAIHLLAIVGMTVGFYSQLCAITTFITLSSIHNRNPLILHSGDVLLRIMVFIFALEPNADIIASIFQSCHTTQIPPWRHRLLQILISSVYLKSLYWKLMGNQWRDGTAIFYVLSVRRYIRFNVPAVFHRNCTYKILSWGTLVIWGSLGGLIWINELTYYVLAAGLIFHICMDLTLRIRLFQWIMITGLVLFVRPNEADLILRFCGLLK